MLVTALHVAVVLQVRRSPLFYTHVAPYVTPPPLFLLDTSAHVCIPPCIQLNLRARTHAQITQAAAAHVACARQKGWTLPELIDPPSSIGDGGEGEGAEPWTMAVKGLLPYWMPRGRGVENSVDLQCVPLCM